MLSQVTIEGQNWMECLSAVWV